MQEAGTELWHVFRGVVPASPHVGFDAVHRMNDRTIEQVIERPITDEKGRQPKDAMLPGPDDTGPRQSNR